MSVLLIDKSDSIATLTLNRPEAMNALSGEVGSPGTELEFAL